MKEIMTDDMHFVLAVYNRTEGVSGTLIWDKINLFLALTSGTLLMSGAWLVPSWLLWIMLGISVWISIFHYLKTRKQPYLHMVAVAFYVSGLGWSVDLHLLG